MHVSDRSIKTLLSNDFPVCCHELFISLSVNVPSCLQCSLMSQWSFLSPVSLLLIVFLASSNFTAVLNVPFSPHSGTSRSLFKKLTLKWTRDG